MSGQTFVEMPNGIMLPKSVAFDVVRQQISAGPGAYPSARAGNKNVAGWETSYGSADSDTLFDLPTLRRQARDLVRANPLAGGAVENIVSNTINLGIFPQSRIDSKFLGLTDEAAMAWQAEAERLFWLWADSENADVSRKLNFWALQELTFRSMLENGDVLVLRRFKQRGTWPLAICLQLVESDRLSTPTDKTADPQVRGGVELDSDGEPIAYHIANKHPGDNLTFTAASPDSWKRVPARDEKDMRLVLHLYRMLRVGQTRGVSILATIIEPLKQLGRFTDAELTAAVVSGMFSVFIETPAPSGMGVLPGQIPGMAGTGGTPGVSYGAGHVDIPNGTTLTKMAPGMITELQPGEKISTANPGRPNTAFDPFVMAILRQIGVGLNVPYEVLIKHFTASYSASRAAIMDAYKTFQRWRSLNNGGFNQPVWEFVLYECVARGYLNAPGFLEDPQVRAAYCQCEWVGSPMPSIDPLKEANAAEKWMQLGIKPAQEVTMETTGRDWEANQKQFKREAEVRESLGLGMGGASLPGSAPASPDPASPDNTEDLDTDLEAP